MRPLPILLLALPLIEIALFAAAGSRIGVAATLGLVILSGMAGILLMQRQGMSALNRMRSQMEPGKTPGREMVHDGMIMLAGILLLIPGFFTDLIGLALLIPPVRDFLFRRFAKYFMVVRTAADGKSGPTTITLDADDYRREQP